MKTDDLALLLRLRRYRADAAERALVRAKQSRTDHLAQRDLLSARLDQAEADRQEQVTRLRTAGAAGAVTLDEVLALMAASRQQSDFCMAQRQQVQHATAACIAAESVWLTATQEHRRRYQVALKIDHILHHQTDQRRRRRGLQMECEGEEEFRALTGNPSTVYR